MNACNETNATSTERQTTTRWGNWRLNPERDTLEYLEADGSPCYEISLPDAMSRPAHYADCVCGVPNDDRAGLPQAIQDSIDLLHAIQDTSELQGWVPPDAQRIADSIARFAVDDTDFSRGGLSNRISALFAKGPEETTVLCPKCGSDRNHIVSADMPDPGVDREPWEKMYMTITLKGACGHVFLWQIRQDEDKSFVRAEFVRNIE